MSSRQEEKKRRREERMERERKEKAAAARRKRLQFAGGGVLGLAAIAAVIALVVAGIGGGGDGGNGDGEGGPAAPESEVTLPQQQFGDLDQAAEAAGCKVTHAKPEGAAHEEREFTADDYKTNPPTSGTHFPTWYEDGVYAPGTTPQLGMLVHTLEHGRINVQYKPGTPQETVDMLEAFLVEQNDGYHMLLYENTTGMDAAVAATAWEESVTCPQMNEQVIDVLRTFRQAYIDQGPENVP